MRQVLKLAGVVIVILISCVWLVLAGVILIHRLTAIATKKITNNRASPSKTITRIMTLTHHLILQDTVGGSLFAVHVCFPDV